jgi:ribosomal protein S12 methylthiotransferase accessory factor
VLRPKFKEKYHIEYVHGEGVFLLGERDSFVLEGWHLAHIVPLIDGSRSVEEIVAAVSPWVQSGDAYQALHVLERAGHVVEADPLMPVPLAAFWSELNADTRFVAALLMNCSVQVAAFGPIDLQPFVNTLQAFGLRVDLAGAVRIALVDDYLRPELAELNRQCLAHSAPLLLVKPVGVRLWIGPLILPGKTACWQCLESRLRGNREVESYVERKSGKPGPFMVVRARIGLGESQAYAMVATQLVRWLITGRNPELESRVLIADLISFSFDFHHIVRRPQCPACGDPTLGSMAGRPIAIRQQATSVEMQAGLRTEPPEATYARLQHHISPFTGVVNAVTPSMWHGAGPIRTYMAGHNFALKSDQLWFLKDGLRTQSSGKGRTDGQARTSALCEALERYSGIYRAEEEPRIFKSFHDLGADAVDPCSCMLFSEQQYRERDKWLARNSRFQIVPLPFRPDDAIEWTPVWSLTQQRVRYLPTSYLFYNYPSRPEQFYCWADSNGAAAGCTLEDAMLQGLLELVERDAVSLWWYNRLRRRAVDLDAYDDGYISEMRVFYQSHGREFWVLDLISDLQIPAFVAISRRFRGPTEDIMLGFGAHFDPTIALTRALTELNQFIPALLNVAPDGTTIYVMGDADARHWWQHATVDNQPYLLPAEESIPCRPGELPRRPSPMVSELLQQLTQRLAHHGYEVMVLNQTRSDIGLPVVKMIVPGLRHFWARFAPGRLYDVPIQLGWLQEPVAEANLNPTPMFL